MTDSPQAVETAASLNFGQIRLNATGDFGQFRTMNDKFGWRVRKAAIPGEKAKTVQYESSAVQSAAWLPIGNREFGLRIATKEGDIVRFDGFKDQDFGPLQAHASQHWGFDIVKKKVATRGWNWGEGKLDGKNFSFAVDGKPAFDLSSSLLSQVTTSKGDLTLVLEVDNDRAEVEDQLLEIRLFVPPGKSGDDVDGAETWREQFLALSGSKASSVTGLCTVPDIKVLVPAGRFDIVISRSSLKLQGKSNDFTIDFGNILKIYSLHAWSSPHVNLVLSLSSPLRKGRTTYPNVVILFDEKKTIDLPVALTDEEIKAIGDERGELQSTMSGKIHDVVSRTLRCLSKCSIELPSDFSSSAGHACFRCSYKAESGNFYPLNKLFIFIPKPVIIIKYEEIMTISFGRTVGSQTKLFEFDVVVKGGQTYSFSSADRQESKPFSDFLASRNIRVKSATSNETHEAENPSLMGPDLPSDESDDEDFEADDDDDDDDSEENSEEAPSDDENKKPNKNVKPQKKENQAKTSSSQKRPAAASS